MKNKLNINENEVKRILSMHKNAIIKENNQTIINEQSTFSLKNHTDFEQRDGDGQQLTLWKGTTFKPSTKIPNSLVTTRKVNVQNTNVGATADNKAYVVFNCLTRGMYLIGNTNKMMKKWDYSYNKGMVWDGTNMLSLVKLCSGAINSPTDNEVDDSKKDSKNTDDTQDGMEYKGGQIRRGTSGTVYKFDYDLVMRAIDDTGKCGRYGTNNSGTSGTQGTSGTSNTNIVLPDKNISREDYIEWTMG